MFTVYILKTSRNTLYIGQTNNLAKRLREHQSKSVRGAKYMRFSDSFALVYTEKLPTRSDALNREAVLRKLTRPQKDELINSSA